ncbi:hypothetical protein HB770_18210 [Rhizobium leguminosarum bv. viciae]|uniref:Uncharacterized protein n=1 Tax=Rhizobium leguminosarum bv. viciae TaxID=387 RepID=A0A7G6RH27_RHILV|nr:hypothetical protein HB770_18210 [Rhizobium leguminosarum bv. viciae]
MTWNQRAAKASHSHAMAYSYIEFPYLPPTRDIAEILAGREEEIEELHTRNDRRGQRSNGMITAFVEIFSGFAEAADRGRIADLLSRA